MYIKRDIEETINSVIKDKEIIAILGPRQCGKSTLAKHILEKKHSVNKITFDDVKTKILFETDIDSFIELHVKPYKYLFIDEVQYAKKGGEKLKYIYDTQNIKIIITGSSATEISLQSAKYLVGRIFLFHLFPFSFGEFLRAKDESLFTLYSKKKYGLEIEYRLHTLFEEFLLYGGYPRVVLEQNSEKKKLVLQNIYNTYLLKEIRDILGLSESDKLIILLKALSLQIGNLLNYTELSQTTGFSYVELKRFIAVLEKTFICKLCKSFHTNKRTELVKMPKVYFVDYGFRNICIDNFSIERTDKDAIYENGVFSEKLKKGIELQYWRKKSGAEVDFVQKGIPIEIKSQSKITKSFIQFLIEYTPAKAYIISPKSESKKMKERTPVFFESFVRFV
ncbi:MAG: ATP-binding protein [Candidatus Woesearchaeota archaeon]